jgi:hypothetical protein
MLLAFSAILYLLLGVGLALAATLIIIVKIKCIKYIRNCYA